MFHSALAAALRHLFRGKLYAAIAVIGLAVGLCAALLAALYIRSLYSFEHFVVGYQDVYQATTISVEEGGRKEYSPTTPQLLAALMKQRFPGIASVSRLTLQGATLRRGDVELGGHEGDASLFAVDPNFFSTVPLAVLAGDPVATLAQPNQVVMTLEYARRFFGEDSPLGRTLEAEIGGQAFTLTVGAVVEDIPVNGTRLFEGPGAFVSGESSWTRLASYAHPPQGAPPSFLRGYSRTLLRLHPGAGPESIREGLRDLAPQLPDWSKAEQLDLIRIDRLQTDSNYNPSITTNILGMGTLALVVLFIAGVNFVNLLTARSGARSLEIGMRKLAGASRAALALQFVGEAFLHVFAAVVLAVAMTELLLPHANAFLMANAHFEYWKEPALLGWLLAGTVPVGLLAGFWPAVVLSRMSPLGAIQGTRLARGGGGLVRRLLVALQFALLIGLILKKGVTYLQRHFGMEQALRFDTDKVLILNTGCSPGRMTELRKLAGVSDAACSRPELLGGEGAPKGIEIQTRDGHKLPMTGVVIDERMLRLYGVRLLAGRELTADDFGVGILGRHSTRVLINESAMRALGFGSPDAALGPYPLMKDTPTLSEGRPAGAGFDEIVGVVPDFSMAKVGRRIAPTVFYADPQVFMTISLKLKSSDIPSTLMEINRVWKSTSGRGGDPPVGKLSYVFYNDRVERMYYPMKVEESIFGIMALVAISLALLGMLGLAASAADQRTKEIGIRKALGATTGDVLRLLLWQFSKPVVWANLMVWPIAGWTLRRWLDGFAYHIDLPLWLFAATALATLLIALATVSAHALRVARAKPVMALRYE
ncbi:MAG: FtsX-like permease family protein [Pseudomonadota bacterium]